jgi:uncharacterized protein (TIGR03086 family)
MDRSDPARTDIFAAMERSYASTAGVVAELRPDHATLPTPCPLFDVRALYGHLVGVLEMFTAALTEQPYDPPSDAPFDGDIAGRYAAAAEANRAAWAALDTLDRTITMPFGPVPAGVGINLNVIDVFVHGWDLATAIGIDVALPADVAEMALGFTEQMLKPEMRSDDPGASFGPEVEVPADAPVADRLLAFLGRRP